jgi:hypothetical protein
MKLSNWEIARPSLKLLIFNYTITKLRNYTMSAVPNCLNR